MYIYIYMYMYVCMRVYIYIFIMHIDDYRCRSSLHSCRHTFCAACIFVLSKNWPGASVKMLQREVHRLDPWRGKL